MPVENYGVLIGSYEGFHRDTPTNEGKYLHGHVMVGGAQVIDCAVDCNHSTANVDFIYLENLDVTKLQGVQYLSSGYHALPSTPTSGALDYVRNPFISERLGCLTLFNVFVDAIGGGSTPVWTTNAGDSAVAALEAMVRDKPIARVLVFGARWNNPAQSPPWGMHDIHFNQGDPPGRFQHLDGVWQDGGVVTHRVDGGYDAFLVKFTTQTMDTNDTTGLPN